MTTPAVGQLVEIRLAQLRQDDNLRVTEDDEQLKELAESIKSQGILEPVLVALGGDGKFSLIAGYRRCAAAKKAGLLVVPGIVTLDGKAGHSLNDVRVQQLIENAQRKDLTPIEEARAFKALVDSGVTQSELAKLIGKSQPFVANRIRLLGLPESVVPLIESGKLTASAAQQILKLPEDAATEIKRVVRQIEQDVHRDGSYDPRMLRYAVSSAQTSYDARQRKQKVLETTKFPNCPAKNKESGLSCGAKGHVVSVYDVGTMRCRFGHRWSAKTGKVEREISETSQPVERPKPTLPLIESIVKEHPGAPAIARRVLDAVKEIKSIHFRRSEGTDAFVELRVSAPPLVGAQLPNFEIGRWSGKNWLDLTGIEEYTQQDDRGRKRAAEIRGAMEAWLGTFGKPGRKPAKKEA